MKKIILNRVLAITLGLSLFVNAQAFIIKDIRILGLQGLSSSTVMTYVPVRVGQNFEPSSSGQLIKSLYQTGFFDEVALGQEGDVLVIRVVERPTIGDISITGNRDIKKENIQAALKSSGLVKGQIFDRGSLTRFENDLRQQYLLLGKQNAVIRSEVSTLPRNRVKVRLIVDEAKATKIKSIQFQGNRGVSEKELLAVLPVSTTGLFTWFTKMDQYSQTKLEDCMQALNRYYLDHGYLKVRLSEPRVEISPDKRNATIIFVIEEGPLYHFSGYQLSGNYILPAADLRKTVLVKKGDVFSRQTIASSVSGIGEALGNKGYGFPSIDPQPQIDEANKTVFVNFQINAGEKVYVRRINFSGNTKTADYVLRHAMKQNEGELISIAKIKESERQLRISRYFNNVSVKNVPVEGTNNQVDLNYQVSEMPSAQATASMGYGTLGLEFNAGFNQPNFFGTGNEFGINFMARKDIRDLSLTYFNPYYRENLGAGIGAFYTKYKPGEQGVANYTTDKIGGSVRFSQFLTDYQAFNYGVIFENLHLSINPSIPEYNAYVYGSNIAGGYGTVFNQGKLNASLTYNSYDQFPFPTSGLRTEISGILALPLNTSSVEFYKTAATGHIYLPLTHDYVLSLKASAAYANGFANTVALPFYENYYGGGIGGIAQVRGYDAYSLGPKDTSLGRIQPIGGNALAAGSVELILPYPLSRTSFRTSIFMDAGNVWALDLPDAYRGTAGGPIRLSAGLGIEWSSPFGPMQFSLAKPLNPAKSDDQQFFQFNLSTGF